MKEIERLKKEYLPDTNPNAFQKLKTENFIKKSKNNQKPQELRKLPKIKIKQNKILFSQKAMLSSDKTILEFLVWKERFGTLFSIEYL